MRGWAEQADGKAPSAGLGSPRWAPEANCAPSAGAAQGRASQGDVGLSREGPRGRGYDTTVASS